MQGWEANCGDLKESPLKPKTKKKMPPPPQRIVTLHGIMDDGEDLRHTRNLSALTRTDVLSPE